MFGSAVQKQITNEKIREAPFSPDASALLVRLLEEINELKEVSASKKKKRKEITEADKLRLATGVKSNGIKVATKADALRSWSDVDIMNRIFLESGNPRNYLLWILGIATGLRSVDIRNLKVYNVIDENGHIRDRIHSFEQKTSKIQNCLITDVLRDALEKYFAAYHPKNQDEYLLQSQKTKGEKPIDETQIYRIIVEAGKKSGIPIHFSCHTMRATFSTMAECICRRYKIKNEPIYLVQGLLNHSDTRTTQRYMRASQKALDTIRTLVSDFIEGKTDIEELEINFDLVD